MRFEAKSIVFAITAFVTLWLLQPAVWGQRSEEELAQLFNSKPVTIIVGSSPGGGYDTFGRLVARHVGKYLPGNPSFIVRNVPGGGQLRGLRRAMKSEPDGLTLGILHPRFVQRELSAALALSECRASGAYAGASRPTGNKSTSSGGRSPMGQRDAGRPSVSDRHSSSWSGVR